MRRTDTGLGILRTHRGRRDFWIFLAFAGPNIALILLFSYRPVLQNIQYSLLDWTLGSPTANFIGLGNYVEFFSKGEAGAVLGTTAIFTIATVGGSLTVGNPKLEPFRATNLDLSLEWYFQPGALVSVAVFNKDISNFSETYDPLALATTSISELIALAREVRVAGIAFGASNYATANKTTLSGTETRGKITLSYNSAQELEHLYEVIGRLLG